LRCRRKNYFGQSNKKDMGVKNRRLKKEGGSLLRGMTADRRYSIT
jgi:hypothetical protein